MSPNARKRRAIRSFISDVGPALLRRHGRKRFYSPDEVRRAARDSHAATDYFCFAYCMYCSHADFDSHHQQTGEHCNYEVMRTEVAETHFGGNSNFDVLEAIELGHSHHDWSVSGENHATSGDYGDHGCSNISDGDCGGSSE